MTYSVSSLLGKGLVEFQCPSCQEGLERSLEDAGQTSNCDRCRAEVIVPGLSELDLQREAEAARMRADEQRLLADARAVEELRAREAAIAEDRRARDAAAAQAGARRPPEYRQIVEGASWLGGFATFLTLCGALLIVAGFVGSVAACAQFTEPQEVALVGYTILAPSVVGILAGILFTGFGAMLRMFGALGIAVRDLARNSFPN